MFASFTLFGHEFSTYMLTVVAGGLAVGLLLYCVGRGPQFRRDQWLHVLLAAAGGALVGAHVLFFFTRLPVFWELVTHWGKYVHTWRSFLAALLLLFGGMVFYGGLFGGLVGAWLYCRSLKIDFGLHLDAAVPGIPLFHAFARVGCLLAGCCYGVPSEHGWYLPDSPTADHSLRYFPIQLVESGANLLLFAVLLLIYRRGAVPKGKMLWLYFPLYAAMRFTLEFWRGDAVRGVWAGLSFSQWISLALLALSAAVWLRFFVKRRRGISGEGPAGA